MLIRLVRRRENELESKMTGNENFSFSSNLEL